MDRTSTRPTDWLLLPGLAALCLLLFGFRLGATGFWTDESIYAQSAREMAHSGDWITPSLCGRPYLIKPVLYHALAGVSFRLLGETEAAGRLPQAAAGALAALGVALLAARHFGWRVGVLAGAILVTSPGFALGSRVAGMDVLLTAGITLSLLCFLGGYREPIRRRGWFLASGLFAGAAMLAKGPLGIAIPAMIILVFLAVERQPGVAFSRPALVGAGAALAVAAVWYLPAWLRHGAQFTRTFWLKNNLARIAEPVHEHTGPIYYYLPVFLFAFLPWSLPFAAHIARSIFAPRRAGPEWSGPEARFLWIWFLAPFLFYSLIATKLPGYLLPVFPAAALLTARAWETAAGAGFRVAAALGAASLPGVALAVPFLLEHRYGIPPQRIWIFPAICAAGAAGAVISALAARGRMRSLWWVAAGAIFVLAFRHFAIAPAAPYESMKEMTEALEKRRAAGYPIALAGGQLKGTLFYTGCVPPPLKDLDYLPRPSAGRPLFVLVKDRQRAALEAWAERGDITLQEVKRRGPLALVRGEPSASSSAPPR